MSMAQRAAVVLEREKQVAGYEGVMRAHRMRVEADAEEVLNALCELFKVNSIPMTDFNTIKHFVNKLGVHEVIEAVTLAYRRQSRSLYQFFRYFCGICWKKIREREEFA